MNIKICIYLHKELIRMNTWIFSDIQKFITSIEKKSHIIIIIGLWISNLKVQVGPMPLTPQLMFTNWQIWHLQIHKSDVYKSDIYKYTNLIFTNTQIWYLQIHKSFTNIFRSSWQGNEIMWEFFPFGRPRSVCRQILTNTVFNCSQENCS